MRTFFRWSAVVAIGLAVAAGVFLLGRFTAPSAARPAQRGAGGYFAGLRAGEAQGREEGRASQEGAALPRSERHVARHAFRAGYVAGSNDVFAGYDGGWQMRVPWLVTLVGGHGQIVYRIRDREQLEPGFAYYLCAGGHSVCRERRR